MRRTRTAALMATAAVALGALWGPAPGLAQEAGDPDTVTVSARKAVDVEPDIGRVTVSVRSEGDTAQEATDLLTDRARNVIDALKAAGFTDDEIDTVNVNLDRRCLQYCRRDAERDPIIGFVGSSGVRAETGQLDRLGEVIDIGINAGASRVQGVSFDVEDDSAAVLEALRQAMLFAQEKATTLAETGNRTLGRALIIIEGNSNAPRRFAVSRAVLAGFVSGGGGSSGGSNPFPIEPPTLSASARVQVTFQLN